MPAGTANSIIETTGVQDIHLTGNPEITHFKSVFRRHVRFSKNIEEHTLTEGDKEFFGGTSNIEIPKNGDLLGEIYLEVDIEAKSQFDTVNETSYCTVNHFGNSLLKEIKFLIGDEIESLDSQWLQIWKELNPNSKNTEGYHEISSVEQGGKAIPIFTPGKGWDENYWSYDTNKIPLSNRIVGDCPLVFGGSSQKDGLRLNSNIETNGEPFNTKYTKKIFIPLPFWFTKNPGLYLPIKSLTNKTKIQIIFENKDKLIGNSNIQDLKITRIKLLTEFYLLEKDISQRFLKTNHEYLIETIQKNNFIVKGNVNTSDDPFSSTELTTLPFNLSFNHPIKYICWAVTNPGTALNNSGQGPCYFISQCSNSQQGHDGQDGSAELYLNNQSLTETKSMSYYTRLIPMKYCNNIPELDRIAMYSFALNPFSLAPSGTCNLSKFQYVRLDVKIANKHRNTVFNVQDSKINNELKIHIYAVGYNILKVNKNANLLYYP